MSKDTTDDVTRLKFRRDMLHAELVHAEESGHPDCHLFATDFFAADAAWDKARKAVGR